jgi:SAM-dependent methyltransferase
MIIPWLAYGLTAYTYDVFLRPQDVARRARAAADARGKPLLNVGAGTNRSSARVMVFGDTAWGDVNVDITGTGAPQFGQPDHVFYADAHDLPFPDKTFGAVIASHVLEQCRDPQRAVAEFRRVADEVHVVCTRWWDTLAWLHPGQRWLLSRNGTFIPWGLNAGSSRRAD